MESSRNVTVIPARPRRTREVSEKQKLRVAAYCRVSTDSDEQATSYEVQIEHYTSYIQANPEWKLAGVYADDGITGTNTKMREQFNKMIADCMNGKIDMIITKSISRFARNTLDCLKYIRQLKDKEIPVFFEKENINTMDSKGEIMLTIMASLAQQESQSLSQNVKLGIQYRYQQGEIQVNHKRFLGYTKDENKQLVIDPKGAEVVKRIYREYLEGASLLQIARGLEADGILTAAGKAKWRPETLKKILQNEKYIGDALLQKTYTVDFLTGKSVINNGEVQQYYVQNSHDAIIDPLEWEMVQIELKRRSNIGTSYSGTSPFTSKLTCSSCGGLYGPKVWNSTDKYRKTVWQCNNKFKRGNKTRCQTPTLTEDNIKDAFIDSYNVYLANKKRILEDLNEGLRIAFDTDSLDKKIAEVTLELEGVSLLVQRLIDENSTTTMSQVEYKDRYESLEQTYNKKRIILEELQQQKSHIFEREVQMKMYIRNLENASTVINAWDQKLWNLFVDRAIVSQNGEIKITFKHL